jgi:hypothetical protein
LRDRSLERRRNSLRKKRREKGKEERKKTVKTLEDAKIKLEKKTVDVRGGDATGYPKP